MTIRSFITVCVVVLVCGSNSLHADSSEKAKTVKESPNAAGREHAARIESLQAIVNQQAIELRRLEDLSKEGAVAIRKVFEARFKLAESHLKLAQAKQDSTAAITLNETLLNLRKSEAARMSQLFKKGLVSDAQLKQAELAVLVAASQLVEARLAETLQQVNQAVQAPRDPKLQALLQERRDVLRKQFELVVERIRVGEGPRQDILRAAGNLLEAELELATSPAQRVKLFQSHVETLKKLEQSVQEMVKVDVVQLDALLEVKAARLKAEIRLHRAKAKLAANHSEETQSKKPREKPTKSDRADSSKQSQHLEIEAIRKLGGKVTVQDGKAVEVNLTDSAITDTDMELLGSLTSLERLTLNGSLKITNAGLAQLRTLTRLQGLALERTNVTNSGMEHLEGLSELGYLSLNCTRVGDAGLKHLAGLKKIGVLYLCQTRTTDEGLAALKNMKQLSWLDLRNTRVTDSGLKHLSDLSHMRLLSLYGIRMTDAGIEPLVKLTNLESLTLNQTQVTDAGVIRLAKLSKLIDLDLLGSQVTEQGRKQIQAALPQCKID